MLAVATIHSYMEREDDIDDAINEESKKNNTDIGDLVYTLSYVAAAPPPYPVNTLCYPPPLPTYPSCQGETGLTGRRLERPRKIILMILFAFEVDTLEIALREQMELLDKVFIVESTLTHKGVSNG